MVKFIRNIVIFIIATLIVGEIVVRLTHAVSDLPQRKIDEYGIQKYYPNQTGYWLGGTHTWVINELGWPGELPKSYNNLITVIGDSFIENFMNANECHQSVFLKERMDGFNFLETARSGVSLIEAFEIAKQIDSLKPLKNLIYVTDSDFYESVKEISIKQDITQLDIENSTIVYGEMKAPGLKKVLYNWKLFYYFYNRFPINFSKKKTPQNPIKKYVNTKKELKHSNEVEALLKFIKNNYKIDDKVLVFHPTSSVELIQKSADIGFDVIALDSSKESKSWTFDYDHHWTCYGHKQVAEQIANYLKTRIIPYK